MKGKYKVLRDNIKNVVAQEFEKTLPIIAEEYETKIQRQAEEITRLLTENKKLKEDKTVLNAKIDAYELYGDQHEEEYNQAFNQGAEAAWELANKIKLIFQNSGTKIGEVNKIFGNYFFADIFEIYAYTEAAAKVEEWEQQKEEIKVGDVIEDIHISKVKCVVTNLYPDNMAYSIFGDGTAGMHELNNFKKTGRHIDIDSFLKQIGGEKE